MRGWLAAGVTVLMAAVLVGADTAEEKAKAPAEEAAAPGGSLDLPQQVSQLMLVTLSGSPTPSTVDRRLLERYTPGGVLLPPQIRPLDAREYVKSLREIRSAVPMLIGTNLYDLPKGRNAPNEFFFQLPSLLSVAAANDPDSTGRLGEMMARQLKSMGLNLNLGPSLELAPTLPDVRGTLNCLGSDPDFAAEAGGAIVKALLDNGIVAVPMGFPGGGANRRAKEPAVLVTPRALLEQQDLLPYRKAIEAGAPVIHVGNTYVPTLERGKVPASLSAAVMRELLRNKLGFKGVIVAGPMDTNDVALAMDPSKAAIESLRAGADMIVWNEAGSRVMKTVDDIVEAVKDGRLSKEVIEAAVRRVVDLKVQQGLKARELPGEAEASKLERDRKIPETVYEIERRAITLVLNRDGTLPLTKKGSVPVGVTGEVGVEELYEPLSKELKYVKMQPIVTAKHSGRIMDFEINRLTSHVEGLRTAICVFTDNGETRTKVELVRALKRKNARVVVVLLGYPSSLPALSDADAILVAYCGPSAYAETIRAIGDVLLGEAPVAVVAGLREVRVKAGEPGAFNALHLVHSPAGTLPVTVGEDFKAGMYVPYNPELSLKKAVWDFGDGKKVKDFVAAHTFEEPGRYPVTLTVEDKRGEEHTNTLYAVVE
ncbi:MAG: glycoside hydrolase family 3 N-terminal domain-containing protein [FCB group bacterium]|jgi:beta-N-acetylhexosaminidase|nr:glycoside hydrolase family 3 N-terminal domain-containing protein [FCB group bacterium]